MKKDKGIKFDQEKLRLDLITPEMLRGLGEVLTYGAGKYAPRNWEEGISYDRLYAAAMRHMLEHNEGQRYDPESKCLHLAHAFCCIGMALTLDMRGYYDEDHGSKYEDPFTSSN